MGFEPEENGDAQDSGQRKINIHIEMEDDPSGGQRYMLVDEEGNRVDPRAAGAQFAEAFTGFAAVLQEKMRAQHGEALGTIKDQHRLDGTLRGEGGGLDTAPRTQYMQRPPGGGDEGQHPDGEQPPGEHRGRFAQDPTSVNNIFEAVPNFLQTYGWGIIVAVLIYFFFGDSLREAFSRVTDVAGGGSNRNRNHQRNSQSDMDRRRAMAEARSQMQSKIDKEVEEAKKKGHTVKKRKVNKKEEEFMKTAAYVKATTGDWSKEERRETDPNVDRWRNSGGGGGGGVSSWNNPQSRYPNNFRRRGGGG